MKTINRKKLDAVRQEADQHSRLARTAQVGVGPLLVGAEA